MSSSIRWTPELGGSNPYGSGCCVTGARKCEEPLYLRSLAPCAALNVDGEWFIQSYQGFPGFLQELLWHKTMNILKSAVDLLILPRSMGNSRVNAFSDLAGPVGAAGRERNHQWISLNIYRFPVDAPFLADEPQRILTQQRTSGSRCFKTSGDTLKLFEAYRKFGTQHHPWVHLNLVVALKIRLHCTA
eukprot:s29_g73.t1